MRPYLIRGRGGENGRLRAPRAALLAVVTALAAAVAAVRVRRVVVSGPSMLPTLAPGDRLLVLAGRRARPGALVVVADPREPDRRVVKRVAQLTTDGVVVLGDNPAASTDSRNWGPLPRRLVRGTVVYRYHPAERAGPLRRRADAGTPGGPQALWRPPSA